MALVECVWCSGTGIDGPGESPCQSCGGDGYVNVPDPPTACGRCKGGGKIKNEITGEVSRCAGCKGTGWAK